MQSKRHVIPSYFDTMKRMARKILRCNIKSAKIHTVKKNNNNNKLRHVLGIETSCDDTGIAIVDEHGTILAEGLSSQWDVHEQYGGVYPFTAARAHQNNFQHVSLEQLKHDTLKLGKYHNSHRPIHFLVRNYWSIYCKIDMGY